MHAFRTVAIASVALVAALSFFDVPAHAKEAAPGLSRSRLFSLVNATSDSMLAVALAPAGSKEFADVLLGEPLQGGLTSTAIRIAPGPCLRDLAIDFKGGRRAELSKIDVCRSTGVRLSGSATTGVALVILDAGRPHGDAP
jgi:hypothetical protein